MAIRRTKPWAEFVSGIYIDPAQHLPIKNNYLHNNTIGDHYYFELAADRAHARREHQRPLRVRRVRRQLHRQRQQSHRVSRSAIDPRVLAAVREYATETDGNSAVGTPCDGSGMTGIKVSTANPGLVDFARGDVHLTASSPFYKLDAPLRAAVTQLHLESDNGSYTTPNPYYIR